MALSYTYPTDIVSLTPKLSFVQVDVTSTHDSSSTGPLTLNSGHGARLIDPAVDDPFIALWWNTDYSDPFSDPNAEFIRVTARSGDSLTTVTRGELNTSASDKGAVVSSSSGYVLSIVDDAADRDDIAYAIPANVKAKRYGALGDNTVADEGPQIQAAVDAVEANGGGTVFIPKGTYRIDTTITVDSDNVCIRGELGTILKQEALGDDILEIVDCDDVCIRDIKFEGFDSTTSASGNSAIHIRSTAVTPAIGDLNRIKVIDCTFDTMAYNGVFANWTKGLELVRLRVTNCNDGINCWNCSDVDVDDVYIDASNIPEGDSQLPSTLAFNVNAGTSANCENIRVRGGLIENRTNAQAVLIHSGLGVTITGLRVENCMAGILAAPASSETGSSVKDVTIDGCHLHGVGSTTAPAAHDANTGITISGEDASDRLDRVTITNCILTRWNKTDNYAGVSGSHAAISVTGSVRGLVISNCDISDTTGIGILFGNTNEELNISGCNIRDIATGNDGGHGIEIKTSATIDGMIRGCYFDGMVTAIRADGNASGVSSGWNRYSGSVTNEYVFGGSGSLDQAELEGTATWDPASVADGNTASTTVTVTGAVVGDVVSAAHSSLTVAGVLLFGSVTAADTVTVTLVNHSGVPYDMASGTLRVIVWRVR